MRRNIKAWGRMQCRDEEYKGIEKASVTPSKQTLERGG